MNLLQRSILGTVLVLIITLCLGFIVTNQAAGVVAGLSITAAGPAVREVHQDLQALADDVVGPDPGQVGDKPHAARVVFVGRVVQALCGGQSGSCHDFTVSSELHTTSSPRFGQSSAGTTGASRSDTGSSVVSSVRPRSSATKLAAGRVRCLPRR